MDCLSSANSLSLSLSFFSFLFSSLARCLTLSEPLYWSVLCLFPLYRKSVLMTFFFRELAFQIAEQFRALGSPCHLRVEVIIGGRDMIQQSISLSSKPHIIIATPGRLLDHLQSNKQIKLDRIKYLVRNSRWSIHIRERAKERERIE